MSEFVTIKDSTGFHTDEAAASVRSMFKEMEGVIPYKQVYIHAVHDKLISLKDMPDIPDSDVLNVYIWVYFSYDEIGNEYTGKLYGFDNFIHDDFNPQSGSPGAIIIRSPENIPVAEYNKDKAALFILFDACHTASSLASSLSNSIEYESIHILKCIVDDFATIFGVVSKEELEKKRKAIAEERKRKAIEENIKARIQARVTELKSKVDYIEGQLKTLRHDYTAALSKLPIAMEAYEAAQKNTNESINKVLNDLNKIGTMPGIVDYDFDGREFKIVTDTLHCYDTDGNEYLVGRYECSVHFNDSSVRFYNLDEENKRRSYWGEGCHHPHVSYNGEPCLGNSAPMICELVKDYEFTALVTVLKAFLEQANLEDPAGKYVRYWDRVAEDGTIIPAKPAAKVTCDACGEYISDDECCYECRDCYNRVCENCCSYVEDYGDVCASCIDNYTWVDRLDRYVHNDDVYYCEHCNKAVVDDEYEDIHDVIVCYSCRDELYDTCSVCEEFYKNDDMDTCKNCGEYVCEDCRVTTELGYVFCGDDCLHEYDDEDNDDDDDDANITQPMVEVIPTREAPNIETCNTCGLNISGDNMRYTCEKCYASGCPSCIQFIDGAWRCPSCRGGNEQC